MFDFSEITLNSNDLNDNDSYLINLDNDNKSDFIFSGKDFDISYILLPKKKLFEKEINQNSNYIFDCNLKYFNNKENKEKNIIKNKIVKFNSVKEIPEKLNIHQNLVYRKDAYYKHFKAIFARYLKLKANKLKNICFPQFNKNNFSAVSYLYTGNAKQKDNYKFLFFKIKELLILGKDENLQNRQYNNELLIKYIEKNEKKAMNKQFYLELVNFFNCSVEDELINFYQDKNEYENINKDSKCTFFDKYFQNEMGISLLERYGFIKVLKGLYQ